MNLAMAIGPFIGLYVSEHASFQMLFLVGTIIAVIDLILSLFLKIPKSTIQLECKKNKEMELEGFYRTSSSLFLQCFLS